LAKNIQGRKQAIERANLRSKNFMGGENGMPYRATIKPVLQIRTKIAGMDLIQPPSSRLVT
jgi:hypothetical protein